MPKTIFIVKAMAAEIIDFNKHLHYEREQVHGAFRFCESQYQGFRIITAICGIGKVNAATCTAVGVMLYKPDLVINAGVAGGLHADLQVGDVVVASNFIYHDADATAFGYAYGQIPSMPNFYQADQAMVALTLASKQKFPFNITSGLICSGDAFVSDSALVIAIQTKIPDILGLDMESCAIAQACHQLQVPFCCLRAISDAANDQAKQSYDACLVVAVAHVTDVLIELLQQYRLSLTEG